MKESNNDGPMECEDCGKVCQGIQGIRGHRRGCPGLKQVALNRGTEPGKPLVESHWFSPWTRATMTPDPLDTLADFSAVFTFHWAVVV